MKAKLLGTVFLACALCTQALATTYETYAPRSTDRTSEATVQMLEGGPYFWQFQVELQKNTGLQFGHLTRAVELGTLVTKPCGTCELETAGISKGESVYHRHVRPEEAVAYLGDVAIFLPACGNPVRPLKPMAVPRIVQPEPRVAQAPAPKPVPEPRREGCVEGPVVYTTEHLEHPGFYGFLGIWGGMSGGSTSWTTDHHQVKCFMNITETEE